MAINTYLLINTLNVSGLNAPIKRHRVAEMDKETKPIYMLSTKDSFQTQKHTQTDNEGMEKDISCK